MVVNTLKIQEHVVRQGTIHNSLEVLRHYVRFGVAPQGSIKTVSHLEEGIPQVSGHSHHLVLREQPGDFARHEDRVHHFKENLLTARKAGSGRVR